MKGIYLICVLSMMFIVGCSASKSVKSPTTQLEGIEDITESPQKSALYLLDTLSVPVKMGEIARQVFKEEISNDPRIPSYSPYVKELNNDLTTFPRFISNSSYVRIARAKARAYYVSRFQNRPYRTSSVTNHKIVIGNYIEKYLSYKSVKEELASIYASHFTESELMQHADFYYTTLGMTPDKFPLEWAGKPKKLANFWKQQADFYSTPLGRKAQEVMPEFEVQMTQLAESRVKDSLGELAIILEKESKSLPSGLED